ncbi:hypothetical protein J2T13_003609 [Paenibacillus sp. DS2015]|uniref:hypothetical protein n=1 Tax=Paenibacillus sp. DS2015 TaxID=3373917 RepID=UPI003D1B87E0
MEELDKDVFGERAVNEYPKNGEKLFKETNDYQDFAHQDRDEASFYSYLKGYKEVSDIAVDFVVESKDMYILGYHQFPIVFNYRQFLELSLKALYYDYSNETIEVKRTKLKRFSHNLQSVWDEIEPMLLGKNESLSNMMGAVKSYVAQFQSKDGGSINFRYPLNRQLEPVFTRQQRIDLVNLKKRMNELGNFFTAMDLVLDNDQNVETYREELRADWEAQLIEMYAEWDYQADLIAEWEESERERFEEEEAEWRNQEDLKADLIAEWEESKRERFEEEEAEWRDQEDLRAEWEESKRAMLEEEEVEELEE